jgi:hypothetical protein
MFLVDAPADGSAAAWIGAGYGLASLLIITGMALLGTAVARAGSWQGWRRWIVLACGVVLFAASLAIAGPFLAGRLALAAWLALFIALGLALARTAVTVPAPPASATAY